MVVVWFSVVDVAGAEVVVSPTAGESGPAPHAANVMASTARPVVNRMILVIKDRTPAGL
jgi:hypothetical protein